MSMGFLGVLMELYNVSAAVFIIFFCGLAILKLRGMDRDLLKAKLFLNDTIIKRTWIYISIGGLFLALNALAKFMGEFTALGDVFSNYRVAELTQISFLTAFTFSTYNWYPFMNGTIKKYR